MDLEKIKPIILKLAEKYSLELLILFGSKATAAAHQKSDFDVAYLSSNGLNLKEEARFIIDLAPIFKSENIDLVNLKKAPPLLFFAIFKDCQIIYERKPSIFAALRAYSFKKYVETKPLYEEKFQRFKKQISST